MQLVKEQMADVETLMTGADVIAHAFKSQVYCSSCSKLNSDIGYCIVVIFPFFIKYNMSNLSISISNLHFFINTLHTVR